MTTIETSCEQEVISRVDVPSQAMFVGTQSAAKDCSDKPGLKVVHLAGTSRGATWMVEQLYELKARGHQVEAIITGTGPLSEKLSVCDVKVHFAPLEPPLTLNRVWTFVREVYRLAWFFWRNRYDVVHAHLFPTMLLSRMAAWIADVPVRISMVPGPFYMEAEAPRRLESATAWMDTRIIPSCEFTRTLYQKIGVPASQLELVYYGPNQNVFDPRKVDRALVRRELLKQLELPLDTRIVGMVAYFYPTLPESAFVPSYLWGRANKNHEMVIDAIPSVVTRFPDAHFLFVGDGWGDAGEQYLQSVKDLVRKKGLDGCITFMGQREDVPELISTFDVSLQCALNENLGGTIESLLMERPLIGTRVGGIVDSVRQEETGLLVNSSDAPALADAIVRLLDDSRLAMRLAKSGRELMLERFSLERTANDLNSIYHKCVAENQKKTRGLRPGYRGHVAAVRAGACLLWLAVTIWMFCKQEMQARLVAACGLSLHKSGAISSYRGLIFAAAVQLAGKLRRAAYLLSKRLFDIIVSYSLLCAAAPIVVMHMFLARMARTPAFEHKGIAGRMNCSFDIILLSPFDSGLSVFDRVVSHCRWLPCLINVIRGDMSIVGTRLRTLPVADNPEHDPQRWHMAPGLTGWCQLNMRSGLTQSQLNGFDFLYIAHSSTLLDLKILLKTLLTMLRHREKAQMLFDYSGEGREE